MTNPNPDSTRIGASTNFDQELWDDTISLLSNHGISNREAIENFPLFLRRVNLAKFLTHVDIYQKTIGLPGSIVECGVFKGTSLLTFVKLTEIYCPGDTLRRVIGFDTFSGFEELATQDGDSNERYGKVKGGWDASDFLPALQEAVNLAQRDSMIPRFKRVELVKGDASLTVPEYVKNNPGLRISLLHLDMDLYQPTLTALQCLYSLVVPGGVVLLDEYGMEGFPGESAAFDEFFGKNRPRLQKYSYISTPGGYFIKEG